MATFGQRPIAIILCLIVSVLVFIMLILFRDMEDFEANHLDQIELDDEMSLLSIDNNGTDLVNPDDLTLTLSHNAVMSHIIADRNNKILYCAIPKNSCTIFKLLLHILHNPAPYIIQQWKRNKKLGQIHSAMDRSLLIYSRNNRIAMTRNKRFKDYIKDKKPLQTYAKYINDKSWRKLIVIRDPLERLLSGYLDKCVGEGMDCFGYKTKVWKSDLNLENRNNFTIFVNHFRHNLSEWEKNGPYHAQWRKIFENHFSPQYTYCNLQTVSRYFTDYLFYHHSSIGNDAEQFLRSLDIDIQWFYKWGEYENQTMFESKSLHVTTKDLNQDLKQKANFYRNFYYNKAFAQDVMSLFETDYKLFGIPRPKWVEIL